MYRFFSISYYKCSIEKLYKTEITIIYKYNANIHYSQFKSTCAISISLTSENTKKYFIRKLLNYILKS